MFSNISQLSQKNTSVAAFFNKVLWGFKEAFQSTVTRLDSGHLRVLIIFPSLRAVHYWVAVQQRLSHLGLNILSAIQGMSAIWDIRYWEASLYKLFRISQWRL